MVDGGLRKIFRQYLTGVDWQAIESGGTGGGIPDLNGCIAGKELWIECKAAAAWRVKISPAQVAWAERRLRHGGRVFLAVRRAGTELWLFPGWSMRVLCGWRLDLIPALGRWYGGPARWDWEQVRKLLSS